MNKTQADFDEMEDNGVFNSSTEGRIRATLKTKQLMMAERNAVVNYVKNVQVGNSPEWSPLSRARAAIVRHIGVLEGENQQLEQIVKDLRAERHNSVFPELVEAERTRNAQAERIRQLISENLTLAKKLAVREADDTPRDVAGHPYGAPAAPFVTQQQHASLQEQLIKTNEQLGQLQTLVKALDHGTKVCLSEHAEELNELTKELDALRTKPRKAPKRATRKGVKK